MNKPARKLNGVLIAMICVLVAAVAFQGIDFFREKHEAKPEHLSVVIPKFLPGWTTQELELGKNEFIQEKVAKILNYDEFVNRAYVRGAQRFELYVGYWGPGKMPTRLVASHTPDRCWTENGWKCLEMKFQQQYSVDEKAFQPTEWRYFETAGSVRRYVMYWHLVDGEVYDYGARFNAVPHPLKWLEDAVSQALKGSREQYFIRIVSEDRFETLWRDVGFRAILRAVGELGVYQKNL